MCSESDALTFMHVTFFFSLEEALDFFDSSVVLERQNAENQYVLWSVDILKLHSVAKLANWSHEPLTIYQNKKKRSLSCI